MVKVSIKKNVKPKKTIIKQKQKQTQKVTVNIGSNIIKKRNYKKKENKENQPVKQKLLKESISQPSITSYNQPIFKPPSALPVSSLASSILATQPNIASQEIKNESAINRALQEQITNIDTDPEKIVNDLEKAKKYKKPTPVKPPIIPPTESSPLGYNMSMSNTDQIRRSLITQRLDEQGDDTEEIERIKAEETKKIIDKNPLMRPALSTIPFYPIAGVGAVVTGAGLLIDPLLTMSGETVNLGGSILSSLLSSRSTEPNPLTKPIQQIEPNPLSNPYQQPIEDDVGGVEESKEELYQQETKDDEPILRLQPPEPEQTILQPPEQTILQPPEPEPTILQPPEPEPTILEPVQPPPTILQPPEPEPTILEPFQPPPTILEPPEPPPEDYTSIMNDLLIPPKLPELPPMQTESKDIKKNPSLLEPSATKSSLTQALQAEEPQASQVLEATPVTQAISTPENLTGYEEALYLFKKLKIEGKIDKKITQDKPSETTASGKVKKSEVDFINDINKVPGYENWKTKPSTKGRPKNIPFALATPVTEEIPPTILEGKTVQPTILEVAKAPPTILEVVKAPPTILEGKTKDPQFQLPQGQESILDYYDSLP